MVTINKIIVNHIKNLFYLQNSTFFTLYVLIILYVYFYKDIMCHIMYCICNICWLWFSGPVILSFGKSQPHNHNIFYILEILRSTFPIVHVFLKYNVLSDYSSNVFILLQIIDFYIFY